MMTYSNRNQRVNVVAEKLFRQINTRVHFQLSRAACARPYFIYGLLSRGKHILACRYLTPHYYVLYGSLF